MTIYADPGTEGSLVNFKERYDNFIGGQWVSCLLYTSPSPRD